MIKYSRFVSGAFFAMWEINGFFKPVAQASINVFGSANDNGGFLMIFHDSYVKYRVFH